MMVHGSVCSLIFLLATAGPAEGDNGSPAAERTVRVRTVDLDDLTAEILSVSVTEGVRLLAVGTEDPRVVPMADVVSLQWPQRAVPGPRGNVQLYLVGDQRIGGQVLDGPDDYVRMRSESLGTVLVPIGRVERIVHAPDDAPEGSPMPAVLDAPAARDDQVFMANGDVVRGLIQRVSPEGISVQTDADRRDLPWPIVAGALLQPTESSKSQGMSFRACLTDGAVVRADDWHWPGSDAAMEMRLFGRQVTSVAPSAMISIEVEGGRWEWLSGLSPSQFRQTSLLALEWPYRLDRNVTGGAIRTNGRSYDRGIGVHSQSILVYDLSGRYQRFVSDFGIDEDSGKLADVTVEIAVDGDVRFRRERVIRNNSNPSVTLDVKAARQLELRVLFGERGDLQDRFDWAGAALIR